MKYLIIILLFLTSCQDDPITPTNTSTPVLIKTYQGKIKVANQWFMIFVNNVQYSTNLVEKDLKTGDSIRMMSQHVGLNETITHVYIQLDNTMFFEDYIVSRDFDSTIVIP